MPQFGIFSRKLAKRKANPRLISTKTNRASQNASNEDG